MGCGIIVGDVMGCGIIAGAVWANEAWGAGGGRRGLLLRRAAQRNLARRPVPGNAARPLQTALVHIAARAAVDMQQDMGGPLEKFN